MRDHTGHKRQYSQLSRAWYSTPESLKERGITERFMIGFYSTEGGTSGEFQVRWEMLGNKLTPKLCAYDDSWSALYHFNDLQEEMSKVDDQDITSQRFRAILDGLGIEDITQVMPVAS